MFRMPARARLHRHLTLFRFGVMIVGSGASFIGISCNSTAANASATCLPSDVRALVAPTDTLLAYKSADLYGDSTQAVVMVIRHPVSGKSDYDFDNNPCELDVLRRENGKLTKADGSAKAVDCTYNDVARDAPALSLNDNVTAAPGSIVYVNQKDKGDNTFYFAWSKEKKAWYLQRATASNPDGNSVTNVSASYPKNFAWTTMSSLDPEAIAAVLEERAKASR